MSDIGIYIHVPFCSGKCPYCDFYSIGFDPLLADRYTDALCREISLHGCKEKPCKTVYFGGGTPSLLGGARIEKIMICIKNSFLLSDDCEVTLEANPLTVTDNLASSLAGSGINRISLGVQSGIDSELTLLGRKHSAAHAGEAVDIIRTAGISNISLDLMIATPGQTLDSLAQSIDFLVSLKPTHISSYLMKIEKNTPFHKIKNSLSLADDDTQADMYLASVERLKKHGYAQYEISNFSLAGFESRHNMRYWNCDEYYGFGPSAHGFIDGRRYSYSRDILQYINSPVRNENGIGGSTEEYAMLRLRLTEGLTDILWFSRFGTHLPNEYFNRAKKYEPCGYVHCTDHSISFTPQGFLISNALISEIIY